MNVDTNINITDNSHRKLKAGASRLKITKNELVILLITKYLTEQEGKYEMLSRVRYQKKQDHESWDPIHVWFTPAFYNKCLNLRMFHKLSLSYILKQAMMLYLDEIFQSPTDNCYNQFIFLSTVIKNCPIFIITWGYPQQEIIHKLYKIYKNSV